MAKKEQANRPAKLLFYKLSAVGAVVLISMIWFNYQGKNRADKQNKDQEIRLAAMTKLAKNPIRNDYYQFKFCPIAKEGQYPSCDYPWGRVLSDDGWPLVSMILVHQTSYNNPSPTEIIKLFSSKEAQYDTVTFLGLDLLRAIAKDSFTVSSPDSSFRVLELTRIERINGPSLRIKSYSDRKLTVQNIAAKGSLTGIENILGRATVEQPFPFEIGQEMLSFNIEKDENGEVEFLLKGKSEATDNWVARVMVKNNNAFAFVE